MPAARFSRDSSRKGRKGAKDAKGRGKKGEEKKRECWFIREHDVIFDVWNSMKMKLELLLLILP